MNKYLVPMWSNTNHKMKNHLVLIEASNRYQAMLIAIGTYTYPVNDNKTLKDNTTNVTWHVDRNYKAYQECNNPDQIFTSDHPKPFLPLIIGVNQRNRT